MLQPPRMSESSKSKRNLISSSYSFHPSLVGSALRTAAGCACQVAVPHARSSHPARCLFWSSSPVCLLALIPDSTADSKTFGLGILSSAVLLGLDIFISKPFICTRVRPLPSTLMHLTLGELIPRMYWWRKSRRCSRHFIKVALSLRSVIS